MSEEEREETIKKAVALKYEEGEQAPTIVASGAGEIARRILELAKKNNIPIQENDSLVDILSRLDLGYQIPAETYRAVAEILAFLYRTDEEWRKKQEKKTLGQALAEGEARRKEQEEAEDEGE